MVAEHPYQKMTRFVLRFRKIRENILKTKKKTMNQTKKKEEKQKKIGTKIIAELWRAKRACGAPWVSKSTHPRKFGNHVTVHRPSVRTTGKPMFNLTLSSQFGSTGRLILHTYCTSSVVIN